MVSIAIAAVVSNTAELSGSAALDHLHRSMLIARHLTSELRHISWTVTAKDLTHGR
jgi:hypothetical protein